MAALQAGRWDEGIARLRGVLARQPQFAEVWSNLGFALRAVGRRDEAREALERAVEIAPGLPDAWNLLGLVEQEVGRHEVAIAYFQRALALRPDFALAVVNQANSAQALGRLDAAVEGYARALEMAPRNAGLHYNLGHLHQKATGDYAKARDAYRAAIALDPSLADAHLNLANVLFALGSYDEGWRVFAWRPQRIAHERAVARAGGRYEPPAPGVLPRTLRLRGEQGLGDMLFFLRFAPIAVSADVRIAFNGDARLHPILARTGLFEALSDDLSPGSNELLVADLPPVVEPMGERFPAALALAADARSREAMERRLRDAGPPPWIAITWRAGERSRGLFDRLFKEAPIADLGAALKGVRATWISVQRAPLAGEREALARAIAAPVHDFSDANENLESALGLLDLVTDYVGVSNTNTHLRAGLDRPGRVLVPFAPEWRWGLAGTSPWFPAMTTYREKAGGGWVRALADLRRDMLP